MTKDELLLSTNKLLDDSLSFLKDLKKEINKKNITEVNASKVFICSKLIHYYFLHRLSDEAFDYLEAFSKQVKKSNLN